MKILVAYASRHGATMGIAERIATTLEHEGLDVALGHVDHVPPIGDIDAFVIGSSAYMGHWEKPAAEFVRRHAEILATRPVWLFSSGPIGVETVDKNGHDVFEASRPTEFAEFAELIRPRAARVFSGAYDPNRPGATFAERLVMKMPAIRDAMPTGDFRDWPAIDAWANAIAREIGSAPVAGSVPA